MTDNESSLHDVCATVESVVPEKGIKKPAVEKMLREATAFHEGIVGFLTQGTSVMVQAIMENQYTYHTSINDFDFQKRVLNAIQWASIDYGEE